MRSITLAKSLRFSIKMARISQTHAKTYKHMNFKDNDALTLGRKYNIKCEKIANSDLQTVVDSDQSVVAGVGLQVILLHHVHSGSRNSSEVAAA